MVPGEKVNVASLIAKKNANVIRLDHNQFFSINRNDLVELRITLEAEGPEHKQELVEMLEKDVYKRQHMSRLECNERLEFLGDAVLELSSSQFLFEKYPDFPEGELTKLRASIVCEPTLADCAEELSLGQIGRAHV